ncbi:MAG: dihydrodipicolinate synthase family protein [Lentisphaeria bacterium]|nr:dihydrodipicolinate synthase family protein [Lentisphaeria bacterium]
MSTHIKFEGIYTPVITPFKEDFSIDRDGYARIIERQVELGIHGIAIGGTTGENYALTPEERVWQFSFAHEVINGRVPWIAGVNDIRTETVCEYAAAARDAGAAAILLAVPPYSTPTGKELAQHALAVEAAGKLPVMLYNYPGRSGAEMDRDFLERVGRHSGFQAIKESSGDINRLHMLAREFPHLQLCCGADDQALEFFAWGARCWVCAAANFFAPECVTLYKTCAVEGNFELGRRVMKAMLPLMTVLERGGKFIQCVKYACELDGLPGGPARFPLRPMEKELKRQFRDALETARTTISHLTEEK